MDHLSFPTAMCYPAQLTTQKPAFRDLPAGIQVCHSAQRCLSFGATHNFLDFIILKYDIIQFFVVQDATVILIHH